MISLLRKFAVDKSGAALVEFGLVLPVLLIFFAVIVEGGRITWTYQIAAAGVRDASRTLSRIAPADLCPSGSVTSYTSRVEDIVSQSLSGSSVIPNAVTVISVTPSLHCRDVAYSTSDIAVVEVNARIRIQYILGNIFSLFGEALDSLETEIADQSRIYGI